MSASIASAQLAYAHAEKIKNNDVTLQGQTSFNDWKEAIEEHSKSVKVAAHNANPANALQPPPAPQHASASQHLLALMRLTSN